MHKCTTSVVVQSRMAEMDIVKAGYWTFQLVNTFSAAKFTLLTERCHRSLISNPDTMLKPFGGCGEFGALQYVFLLNQVRGWNTALLAISLYGYSKGPTKDFLGLACLTSALTTFAHIMSGRTAISVIETELTLDAFFGARPAPNYFKIRAYYGPRAYRPAFVTTLLTLITGWAFMKAKK